MNKSLLPLIMLVVIFAAYAFVIKEYAGSGNDNLDIAVAELSSEAAFYGRTDIIELFYNKVSNPISVESIKASLFISKNLNKGTDFLLNEIQNIKYSYLREYFLARILQFELNRSTSLDLETNYIVWVQRFNNLKNTPFKASALYSFYAKTGADDFRALSVKIMEDARPNTIYSDSTIEMAELALKLNNFDDYLLFLKHTSFSYRRCFALFLPFASPKFTQQAIDALSDKDLPNSIRMFFERIAASADSVGKNMIRFKWRMWVAVYNSYGCHGRFWNLYDYNNPMLMYVAYISDWNDAYKHFFSKAQMAENKDRFKRVYLSYTYYAVIAYSLTGNTARALDLLSKIENPYKAATLYMKTTRYLAKDPNFLDDIASNLLRIYDISLFSKNLYK